MSRVALQVGQSRFVTTTNTLLAREPHSVLYALARQAHDNGQSEIFIDRDGTHMRHILNYLRDGDLVLKPDLTVHHELLLEAKHYKLTGLVSWLEERIASLQQQPAASLLPLPSAAAAPHAPAPAVPPLHASPAPSPLHKSGCAHSHSHASSRTNNNNTNIVTPSNPGGGVASNLHCPLCKQRLGSDVEDVQPGEGSPARRESNSQSTPSREEGQPEGTGADWVREALENGTLDFQHPSPPLIVNHLDLVGGDDQNEDDYQAVLRKRRARTTGRDQDEEEVRVGGGGAGEQLIMDSTTLPAKGGSQNSNTRTDNRQLDTAEKKTCSQRVRPLCADKTTKYSWEEIRTHCTEDSAWLVVRGKVYDVTRFLDIHPAGRQAILRHAGQDATVDYDFHSSTARSLWPTYQIGVLEGYKQACVIM